MKVLKNSNENLFFMPESKLLPLCSPRKYRINFQGYMEC